MLFGDSLLYRCGLANNEVLISDFIPNNKKNFNKKKNKVDIDKRRAVEWEREWQDLVRAERAKSESERIDRDVALRWAAAEIEGALRAEQARRLRDSAMAAVELSTRLAAERARWEQAERERPERKRRERELIEAAAREREAARVAREREEARVAREIEEARVAREREAARAREREAARVAREREEAARVTREREEAARVAREREEARVAREREEAARVAREIEEARVAREIEEARVAREAAREAREREAARVVREIEEAVRVTRAVREARERFKLPTMIIPTETATFLGLTGTVTPGGVILTPYQILGVSPGAFPTEVNRAFQEKLASYPYPEITKVLKVARDQIM